MDTRMPATTNKQDRLTKIVALLKKRYDPAEPEPKEREVLEQFLYAICREGASREQADQAYRNLRRHFFDWNEVRVSSVREIEEVLGNVPDAEIRAGRLVRFLQEVFETTFSFDLELLHKKGLKQAAKQLSRFQAASDFVVAWVMQKSLGGHAIPLDEPMLRTLRRLGLVEEDESDPEGVRASLEHLIPKAKGALFVELLSAWAHDPHWEDDPHCPLRSLVHDGASVEDNGSAAPTMERVNRPKPR
jgi:endonuclease-3